MNTIKKIYNIISWPGRTFEKLNSYSQAKYQKGLRKRIAYSYDLAKEKASEQHKDSELNDEICIENKILIRDHRKFNYFDKFFQIESSDLDSQSKRRQSIHFLMQDLMQFPNQKREQHIADDLMGNLTQFLFDIKIHSLIEKKEIEEERREVEKDNNEILLQEFFVEDSFKKLKDALTYNKIILKTKQDHYILIAKCIETNILKIPPKNTIKLYDAVAKHFKFNNNSKRTGYSDMCKVINDITKNDDIIPHKNTYDKLSFIDKFKLK